MSEQEAHDLIRKQITSNDIVLFMKGTKQSPQCGFSGQVAQILGHLGVDYKDIDVLDDPKVREGIVVDSLVLLHARLASKELRDALGGRMGGALQN